MRLALLVCDQVADQFVEEHGTYPHMFDAFLGIPFDSFLVCENQFPEIEDYDAFLATGSKKSVYEDEDWIHELIVFTRKVAETNKKYVGVCFGHQIIGEALGGKVTRSSEGYLIGIHQHRVSKPAWWIEPEASDFNILMLCQDQISTLPNHTIVHASSAQCPNGVISINDQFLGIQGHPEFTKRFNKDVFISRKDRITHGKVEQAIESLSNPVDTDLLRKWILRFLGVL